MKYRFYLIWIIAIVLMVSITTAGAYPPWRTNPKDRWAKFYNRMPIELRHTYFSTMVRSHTKEILCEITKDIFKGVSKRGLACWAVRCSNDNTYVVVVRDDGSTAVFSCKLIEKRGGQCF